MHPDEWLAQYDAKLAEAKQRADQASSRLAETSAAASSPDGQITVRVNPGGALTDIQLGRGVRDRDPEELARAIMDCYRKAQRSAAGQMVQVMQEFLGDTAALDHVKSQLPHGYAGDGQDEEEADRPGRHFDDDDFGNNTLMR
ncbi:hypothetical protein GCM10012275_52230 [Longimycelium tulufanense]|uniref:YbaB/EbfC DNA-binding family protein n=1 Tax=Longimycelium tulufanense TaxID=907463 RepID=A0A8J3CJA4_9PSEU|nr:YbaB/EbfC family nucleoid-associated protein [Longimycelium tulufanense]GGM75060.1 hypothetical protein GCM10012275_52230 [Longimycelium tulufanense]